MKTCNCCGKQKPDFQFTKDRQKCKECTNAYLKEYRKIHPYIRSESYHSVNRIKQRERYKINKFLKNNSKRKKRVVLIGLYDGKFYAKYNTRYAIMKAKLRIEYDSLWYKFCSLESLISIEAFKTIERINKIEYLIV